MPKGPKNTAKKEQLSTNKRTDCM